MAACRASASFAGSSASARSARSPWHPSIELACKLFHELFCLTHARKPFHAALLLARQPLTQAPCARARKFALDAPAASFALACAFALARASPHVCLPLARAAASLFCAFLRPP
eukprot:5626036-Pleurochrysis_carterae.AAC.1